MKKKWAVLIAIVGVLTLCFVLSGCGGDTSTYDKNFIGSWELCGMETEGEVMSEEDLEFMKAVGIDVTIDLKEDKTAVMAMVGGDEDPETGTWKATSATECTITFDGGAEDINATLDDGKLSVREDSDVLIFKKAATK